MFMLYFVLLGFLCYEGTKSQFHTNFKIDHIERCDSNQGPIRLHHLNITNEGTRQYLNYDLTSNIPIDGKIGSVCFIDYAVDGSSFLPLFVVRENNLCKAANQYMGQFWYDLERASRVSPGVCPILAGRYYVHDYFLDFKKISLQTFPFGKLKFTFYFVNNNNPANALFCMLVDVTNVHV